ncbi:MAG: AP-3 complex subunit delta, partial [Marteilia pararefringens]
MVATGFLVASSLSAFTKEVRNCVSLSAQHSDPEQQHNCCSETLEAESAESGDNNADHHDDDAPSAPTNSQLTPRNDVTSGRSLWQHSSRAFLQPNNPERRSARHNSAPSSAGALAAKRSINEIAQATLRDFSATLDESEKSKYLLKFFYLFMYNMDLSAAYFPTSKIMASQSFSVKRRAYLFAETCWTNKDEISFLCTNIFCSDIKRKNILRVLPINILANTMSENSAHIILDTVLTNSICADTECRLKMLTLLSSIYITIGAIPNDHLSRLAGSISIQSPNEILMVFISFLIKICSNIPNVSIDFKPALFKILQVKINEPIVSYNLLKLLGKLSETDETLKTKLYHFFEKIVTINLRPSLFFRIVDILCIDESRILTNDSNTLRTAIFQLF